MTVPGLDTLHHLSWPVQAGCPSPYLRTETGKAAIYLPNYCYNSIGQQHLQWPEVFYISVIERWMG